MTVVVSVAVACYNEEKNIVRCLDSLLDQDIEGPYEIMFVDGGSSDATRELIAEYQARHPHIRLLDNPDRVVAGARNVALHSALAPLLAFTDADCKVPRHWLTTLVGAFRQLRENHTALAGVGGGNFPPDSNSPFYKLISIFQKTPFGNRGSVQTERYGHIKEVPHLPTLNVLYDRSKVLQAGGFDMTRFPSVGEDEDLNTRILRNGGRLFYVPGADVEHFQRDNLCSWIKNMNAYGYGRGMLMLCHPELVRWINFVPSVLLLAVLLFPLGCLLMLMETTSFGILAMLPLVLYLSFFLLYSWRLASKNTCTCQCFTLFGLFLGTHLAYPFGMIKAVLYDKADRESVYETCRYISVGLFGTVSTYTINNILFYLVGVKPWLAVTGSSVFGTVLTYFLHMRVTFQISADHLKMFPKFMGRCAVVYVTTLLFTNFFYYVLALPYWLATVVTEFLNMLIGYALAKFWVYKS